MTFWTFSVSIFILLPHPHHHLGHPGVLYGWQPPDVYILGQLPRHVLGVHDEGVRQEPVGHPPVVDRDLEGGEGKGAAQLVLQQTAGPGTGAQHHRPRQ